MRLRDRKTKFLIKKTIQEEEETQYEQQSEPQQKKQSINSIWNVEMLSTQYKPKSLLGRVFEKQQIHNFIKSCIVGEINNRVLYISGVPGVGKTVTTKQIIADFQKQINRKKIQFFYINAMTIKQPKDIYKNIILKMKGKIQSKNTKPQILALQIDNYLKNTSKKHFFLIDQIDFLYTNDEMLIYNLFEWSYSSKGSFSLIIIANTMDFPERLSPKLLSRMGNQRLVFKPYSYSQVKQIIQDRLVGSDLFQTNALQFAARKLSAYTSDIRKIFNVLKQAVFKKSPNKKIQISEIQEIWEQFSIENNEVWRKDLPPMYLNIIQIIKKQGGKSHSGKIHEQIKVKKTGINCIEVQIILQELHQMGIIKVNEKIQNGYIGFNVILLKI